MTTLLQESISLPGARPASTPGFSIKRESGLPVGEAARKTDGSLSLCLSRNQIFREQAEAVVSHALSRGPAKDFDPGMKFFDFVDGRLDGFHLKFGFPNQLAGLLDLHLQILQFGGIVLTSSCHGMSVAIAVPGLSLVAKG
jgi:hypothetical protein